MVGEVQFLGIQRIPWWRSRYFIAAMLFFFFKFIRPTRSGIFITVTKIAALFAIPL